MTPTLFKGVLKGSQDFSVFFREDQLPKINYPETIRPQTSNYSGPKATTYQSLSTQLRASETWRMASKGPKDYFQLTLVLKHQLLVPKRPRAATVSFLVQQQQFQTMSGSLPTT